MMLIKICTNSDEKREFRPSSYEIEAILMPIKYITGSHWLRSSSALTRRTYTYCPRIAWARSRGRILRSENVRVR